MKEYIGPVFCFLLSSMLLHADKTIAELSALTQDGNQPQTRSLCSGSKCGKKNCCGCTSKNNCCTKLQCRKIESKVCLLTECEPTPITGPTTINNPGVYCLANDVTGDFTIDVSNVVFDLNGHTITGSINLWPNNPDDPFTSATIKNGFIDVPDGQIGINCPGGASSGQNRNNILIKGILITNGQTGVHLQNTFNAVVSGVTTKSPSLNGLEVEQSEITTVEHSDFISSGSVGFYITGSGANPAFGGKIDSCVFINNVQGGLVADTLTSGIIQNCFCTAVFCPAAPGFFLDISTTVVLDCVVENYETNYYINQPESSQMVNCKALNALGDGFFITGGGAGFLPGVTLLGSLASHNGSLGSGAGFRVSGNVGGKLVAMQECTASLNMVGFVDVVGATSGSLYAANAAFGNSSADFTPATGAPFSPASSTDTDISFWRNVSVVQV